ncbi:hypothetical protein JCM3765_003451 [Sporobolomyces pararoseus]
MSGTTSSGSSQALYMGAARRQQPVRNQDSTSGHLVVPTSVSRPGTSQSGSPATYRSTGQSDTSSLNPRERELLAAGGIVPDRAAVNGVDPSLRRQSAPRGIYCTGSQQLEFVKDVL